MSDHKKAKDHDAAWDAQHRFEGAHGWIQWKGTNVCMDIHCACGELCHVDGDFAYHVECGACGRVYFCNGHIELIELEKTPETCVALAYHSDDTVDEEGRYKAAERYSLCRCEACGGRGMIKTPY